MSVNVNLANFIPFYSRYQLEKLEAELASAHNALSNGTGLGAEYTGWYRWPETYDKQEFQRVQQCAQKIKEESEVLVVIGIGGSYLGARAGIDFIRSANYNLIDREGWPQIFFVGNNISGTSLSEVMEIIGERDFSVNVISKSGTTTEPAIAFRFLKAKLEQKYGAQGAAKRIYATTDKEKGALRKMAVSEGYEIFTVPDDIGGRFSVLTSVGLLPLAATGIDIAKVMEGAHAAMDEFSGRDMSNPAWQYAAARSLAYRNGKAIEILGCYEPKFKYFAEWWKQLYGESEGKDCKGLFPASMELSTDLHSLGQFVQDGTRNMIETIVSLGKPQTDLTVMPCELNCDQLNYLAGTSIDYINKQAQLGTTLAHVDGGVPNISLEIESSNAENFGELVYFFELSCALSGYMLGVNPFNQPGVEAYKSNMFALLGKPGYEEMRKTLRERLEKMYI